MQRSSKFSKKLQAILAIASACGFFALMTTLMNYGVKRLPAMEIIFARGFVNLLIVIPIIRFKRIKFFGNNLKALVIRGSLGVAAASCIFWAALHMPLANASALFRSTPLFTPLFAHYLLKEKLYLRNILLTAFGFLGVILILRPQSDYVVSYAGVIALLGAVFNALALVSVKHLSDKENHFTIMLYFFILCCLYPPLVFGSDFLMPKLEEWFYLTGVGLTGFAGQYLMTIAFTMASATAVVPWIYSEIVFAAILGFTFLGQTVDLYTLTGIVIIFLSALKIYSPTVKAAA